MLKESISLTGSAIYYFEKYGLPVVMVLFMLPTICWFLSLYVGDAPLPLDYFFISLIPFALSFSTILFQRRLRHSRLVKILSAHNFSPSISYSLNADADSKEFLFFDKNSKSIALTKDVGRGVNISIWKLGEVALTAKMDFKEIANPRPGKKCVSSIILTLDYKPEGSKHDVVIWKGDTPIYKLRSNSKYKELLQLKDSCDIKGANIGKDQDELYSLAKSSTLTELSEAAGWFLAPIVFFALLLSISWLLYTFVSEEIGMASLFLPALAAIPFILNNGIGSIFREFYTMIKSVFELVILQLYK